MISRSKITLLAGAFSLVLIVPVVTHAQKTKQAGFGLGFSKYTSFWFVNRPGTSTVGDSYPIHEISRLEIGGFYGINGIFNIGPVRSDLSFEVLFGFPGSTKEDFLPENETISEGGISGGLAVLLKFGYPLDLNKGAAVPFLGLGPQAMVHHSNGEGAESTNFATNFNYEESWTETIYGLTLGIGIAVELDRFILTPEYRFFITGGGATDWEPGGIAPDTDGADLSSFSVKLGFRLN